MWRGVSARAAQCFIHGIRQEWVSVGLEARSFCRDIQVCPVTSLTMWWYTIYLYIYTLLYMSIDIIQMFSPSYFNEVINKGLGTFLFTCTCICVLVERRVSGGESLGHISIFNSNFCIHTYMYSHFYTCKYMYDCNVILPLLVF